MFETDPEPSTWEVLGRCFAWLLIGLAILATLPFVRTIADYVDYGISYGAWAIAYAISLAVLIALLATYLTAAIVIVISLIAISIVVIRSIGICIFKRPTSREEAA